MVCNAVEQLGATQHPLPDGHFHTTLSAASSRLLSSIRAIDVVHVTINVFFLAMYLARHAADRLVLEVTGAALAAEADCRPACNIDVLRVVGVCRGWRELLAAMAALE